MQSKTQKHKSKFFNFSDIERINNLPNPQKDDGYLDKIDIFEVENTVSNG
jgi:hypothetical protein